MSAMQEVPGGSYIVFLTQPQRYNVVALFEPQIYPNRLTALGEAERPYDVAGWTLPLQMGVDAPAVVTIRETASERKLTLLKDANEVRADLALALKKGDESPIKNPLKQPVRVGMVVLQPRRLCRGLEFRHHLASRARRTPVNCHRASEGKKFR